MENIHGQRWLVIGFFLLVGALFVWFAIFLAMDWTDPFYNRWLGNHHIQSYEDRPHELGEIVLLKNQQQIAGTLKLTYRGKAAGAILLDVVLLQLDPTYTYHRQIRITEAREGFWLSGSWFRVVSAGNDRLRIQKDRVAR